MQVLPVRSEVARVPAERLTYEIPEHRVIPFVTMPMPLRPTLGLLVVVVALAAACVQSESGSPMAESPSASELSPGAESIPESPSATSSPTAESCAGNALVVDCFARITADVLKLRTGPGLDAPQVREGVADGSPIEVFVGRTNGREQVYIADGPVQADGLAWYQVGVMNTEHEQSSGPLYGGWVASGDETDPWLVPEDLCPPAGPVELADLTYAQIDSTWAIHLGCFRDQVLTLRGWFPVLPPEFEIPYDTDGSCFAEPAFLMCGPYNKDIRTIEMTFYDPRNTERLNFTVDPAAGVELPPRGQWITITGAFNHPAAQECGADAVGTLECRAVFVATDISVSQ